MKHLNNELRISHRNAFYMNKFYFSRKGRVFKRYFGHLFKFRLLKLFFRWFKLTSPQNYDIPTIYVKKTEKYLDLQPFTNKADIECKEELFCIVYDLLGDLFKGEVRNSDIELCARFVEEMGIAHENGMVFINGFIRSLAYESSFISLN